MNQQKSFKNMKVNETPKITVAIRKRPLNKKEMQRNETDIVRVSPGGQVVISEYKQKVDLTKYLEQTTFNFDFAYDEQSNNEDIYEQSVRPLIHNAFMGAKISCFAYGQTGSGKTYTMKGDINKGVPGIYYLGARQIFHLLEQPRHSHLQLSVTFYQIYCGKLYDLLNNRTILQIRQDKKGNINVIGLDQRLICSAQQFLELIEYGSGFRVTSQNNTNADSSRSHAILQLSLKEKNKVFSKISFIDLAGNERGADHMDQNKQTKIDGAEINKSLLSLKECIRALDQAKSHTPFRGSKLTMVLKDSFVGYCNTVMICNVSPNVSSSQNTMNTLRYADRVKELKRSDDGGEKLTREQQLSRQLMLPRANNKNCIKVNIEHGDDEEQINNKMDNARNLFENGHSQQPYRYQHEQKMDIQQSSDNRKPQPYPINGRKTQNLHSDNRLFNATEKRLTGKQPHSKSKNMFNDIPLFKGRDVSTQNDKIPLLSRNVHNQKIDQNNLNFSNGMSQDFDKKNKLFSQNNVPQQFNLNRNHYDSMNSLKNDFMRYREDHENLINREMCLIKQELVMKNDCRQVELGGANYQEQIGNVDNYLNNMEKIIMEKMQLLNQMKNNYDSMRLQARSASSLTDKLRYEQNHMHRPVNIPNNGMFNMHPSQTNGIRSQTHLHVHSSMNGLNFNGFNNFGPHDEQLLEGLAGDDSMARLF